MSAVLVACSHGTRSAAGRAAVARLVEDVRALRPSLEVRAAFVDVEQPAVDAVVRDVVTGACVPYDGGPAATPAAVVVPLLLSTGVHVRHDIGAAVRRPGAAAAGPLGPDARLVDVLLDRLAEAGAAEGDAVVVAAAGSSDPAAHDDVAPVVAALAARRTGPVTLGWCAASTPTVADAVTAARAAGARRVAVAAYLLAPGFFHSTLTGTGADVVTAPLAPDPRVAAVVLDRFDAAVAAAS